MDFDNATSKMHSDFDRGDGIDLIFMTFRDPQPADLLNPGENKFWWLLKPDEKLILLFPTLILPLPFSSRFSKIQNQPVRPLTYKLHLVSAQTLFHFLKTR